jgi:hypothetical protein
MISSALVLAASASSSRNRLMQTVALASQHAHSPSIGATLASRLVLVVAPALVLALAGVASQQARTNDQEILSFHALA